MGDSVGQIGLDLVVNQKQFNSQMRGVQGIAKKAGLALAAAFSVKKLVNFSKQCIELGSDLEEVQNVVDVTFPRMSRQIDDFAKNAITSFGLSETMAKRFTGTFGAMAKAFGFTEGEAYKMSTTLTGLAGDIASFYNITQDEAYTKLKSVFTGETESLKDLGVVMTQSALDAYALANGYGKATKNMTEMEKVALRYAFVQDQLSAASGDFIRTSDGWANQVRVLKLQFDSLKATIGQGLINLLTPVIKVINTIIGKLMSLANAFKAFTEMITGKKGSGGATVAASGMDSVASSAGNAGAAMGSAANAAKKAAKDIKTATTGIDELNILNLEDDAGSDAGGSGGYSADDFDMGEIDTSAIDEADNRFQKFFDRMKELVDLFKEGFEAGMGDVTLEPLKKAIEGIKQSLKEIFTDPDVVGAFQNWLNTLAYSLGQIAGAIAAVGIAIATNLLGGLNLYLDQNKELIKQRIINFFDITGEIATIAGNFAQAFANIFSAVMGENGQRVTAALIGIFVNGFLGLNEIVLKLARDILDVITRPFIDNQEDFKAAVDGLLGVLATSLEAIKQVVDDTMSKIGEVYDTYVNPMFDAFAVGLSSIAGVILDVWQNSIQPMLERVAEFLGSFAEQYLQPLIDKVLDFAGTIANAVTLIWTNILQPFIEWFIATILPCIVPILQAIIEVVLTLGGIIMDAISSIITCTQGVIDFLVGVFTGEWSLAWEGIKEILLGTWELIKSIISGAIAAIGGILYTGFVTIVAAAIAIWNTLKAFFNTLWTWLSSFISVKCQFIRTVITTAWNAVNTISTAVWNAIQALLSAAWETISTSASNTFNNIKDVISNAWESLKASTSSAWNGIWDTIRGIINNIISGVESMVNRVISAVNTMTSGLNSVISKIPGLSGGGGIPSIGSVSLPKLAQGGFVRANTPQLAMIGDNRHYGEIVAPEDKMQEMVNRAVAMASGGNVSDQYLAIVVELLQKIIDLIEAMDLTVNIDIREIKKKLTELDKRSGYTLRTT